MIRGGLEPVLDKVPVGKFTKFRSIAGCVYTPGGKFSIIEFGLEKAVRYYYYLLQYHIVRSKLHKTVYNFLKSNREPNQDISELLVVRDPPGSRSTDCTGPRVPNSLQELYINLNFKIATVYRAQLTAYALRGI